MANGFIKLDRVLLAKQIFQNEKLLKIWIWSLLKATHQTHEQTVGLQKIELQPGQFITGRFSAAEELNMNPSTVWKYLKVLENNQSLDIKSNNKFSVVTIVNWEFYQAEKFSSDNKNDSKMTTKKQQKDTNKNDKNVKNKDKKIYMDFVLLSDDEYQKLVEQFGQAKTDEMIERLNSYGHTTPKKFKQYASHYHVILTWARNDKPSGNKKLGGLDLDETKAIY
jgi:hypothetical protein